MRKISLGFLIGAFFLFVKVGKLSAQNTQFQKKFIYDYTLHYLVSTEIAFSTCMFITLKKPDMSIGKKYLLASGTGLVIGVAKELTDLIDDQFDWIDLGFDMAGIGTGILLHYLVFDRKMQRSMVSLGFSREGYMASVRYCF